MSYIRTVFRQESGDVIQYFIVWNKRYNDPEMLSTLPATANVIFCTMHFIVSPHLNKMCETCKLQEYADLKCVLAVSPKYSELPFCQAS